MENMEIQQVQPEEQEIDLLEVFYVLKRQMWLLITSLVAGVVAAALVTMFLITPQYEATSIIYILSKTTSITSLADLQIGSQLAADYQLIATTRDVVEVVMQDLGIEGTYEDFVNTIEVANPTNSHMLTITVTNEDPALAAEVSNAIADQLRFRIAEVMSTDTPSSVSRAVVPEDPSSPSLLVNSAVGGLLFLALAAGVVLVRHFLDDTVKDEDDVSRYLGLNTLAAIPVERSGKNGAPAKGAAPAKSSKSGLNGGAKAS